MKFCTKEHPYPTEYDIYWPRGDYCIFQYDSMCPYPFKYGAVRLHGPSASSTAGVVPTGTYGSSTTELRFCCRNDTVYTQKMFLPNHQPFFLLRFQHGCQQVVGMAATDQSLTFYNDVSSAGSAMQTALEYSHPFIEETGKTANGAKQYKLHYCYYTPISK